ncbi:MAG: hypothetical protein ACJ790_22425 [Myxococcaceae bacterium]
MRLRSTLPFALLLLAACGSHNEPTDAGTDQPVDEDSGTTDNPTPDSGHPGRDAGVKDAGFEDVPVSQWCDSQAWALCMRDVRCLRRSPSKFSQCVSEQRALCDQVAYSGAVAQNRVEYSSGYAASCLNGYAEGSCTDVPADCPRVFTGRQPPDAGCLLPEDCATGSFCYLYSNTCPLTCRAYQPVGASCNFGDQNCDPAGAYCDSPDGGFSNYQCLARRAPNAACTSWSQCPQNYGCLGGQCVKQQAAIGEPCAQTSGYPLCGDDAFCRQDPPATPNGTPPPGVCTKRVGLGGTCNQYGVCEPGLRCSTAYTTGTCIPLGALADICTGYYDCQDGLYCSNKTSRCVELPSAGGDCGSQGSFFRCASDSYCDFNSDLCLPRKAVGDQCTYDDVCTSRTCDYGQLSDGGFGATCREACSTRLDGGV